MPVDNEFDNEYICALVDGLYMCVYLQIVEGLLQLPLRAGAHKVAEDVLEVVDEDLPPVGLQLIG